MSLDNTYILENIVSFPGDGFRGTAKEISRDNNAKNVANIKTRGGDVIQTYPKITGKKTAAIWFIVNATAVVEAKSSFNAIFCKYVFCAIIIA